MMMGLIGCVWIFLLSCCFNLHAEKTTWIAEAPNNGKNDPTNWSSGTVPGSRDVAVFSSNIQDISKNPEFSAPLFVSSIHFTKRAVPFTFLFQNQTLTFSGVGITGKRTDATINILNNLPSDNLLSFLGSTGTSGKAKINISNTGSTIQSHFFSSGDFTMKSRGEIAIGNHFANTTSGQMVVKGSFSAEKDNSISVSNEGGIINGSQFLSGGAFEAGNRVQFEVKNSGGEIIGEQFSVEETLSAGKDFSLTVNNTGIAGNQILLKQAATFKNDSRLTANNSGTSINQIAIHSLEAENRFHLSASSVGVVSADQIALCAPSSLGKSGEILIFNTGTCGGSQLNCQSSVQAGDLFNLEIGNFGTISNGQQAAFQGGLILGDEASINILNIGSTNGQLLVKETFQAGDDLGIIVASQEMGGSQVHLNAGSIGDRASILAVNGGILAGQQFCSANDFSAGNDFSLTAQNFGTSSSQVEFGGACTLGEKASIFLLNSGAVDGCQMKTGNFSAGKDLILTAINTAGVVNDSQACFEQGCSLEDGSLLTVVNSGSITNCQMKFNQGFEVVSGKVFLQAINTGEIGRFGIEILGDSFGGNAGIGLSNSSLSVDTNFDSFTIGGISGDGASFVQSKPLLNIFTDESTFVNFAGAIQDFPTCTSSLIKTGTGIQKLSGDNTYTGLTTVQEGTLILNGSIAGDAFIDTLGTLKGIGRVGGTLTNVGRISPGESIGTLTILGNYLNNGGFYDVEVAKSGQSDLLNVTGQANLSGGTIVVSTEDSFRIQQPYTIVTALGSVVGEYDGAISSAFINPLLTYDLQNVYLTIESALVKAANNCNQFGAAEAIDSIINPNAAQSLLINAIANSSLKEAQKALESLSGFQHTYDLWMTEISVRRFLRTLYNPLRIQCSELTHAWIETNKSYTDVNEKARHARARSEQITGGIQKNPFCDFTFGLAGSYEHARLHFRDGTSRRNTSYFAAYGLYSPSPYYALFDLVCGHTRNSVKRHILVNSVRDRASSKPHLNHFAFYGEAGLDFCHQCFFIKPFIGLQLGKNSRKRLSENNETGFGLSVHRRRWAHASSRLGLHIFTAHLFDEIDTFVDLAWNQLLSSNKNRTKGRFTQFGKPFPICGNKLDRSSIDYAFNFSFCLCHRWKGYLEFGGEEWGHARTIEVLGGLEYSW